MCASRGITKESETEKNVGAQGRAAFMGGRGKPLPYARTTGYRSSRGITKEPETEKNVGAELAPPAYIEPALLLLLLKNNL